MLLKKLEAKGFCCLKSIETSFEPLTVLIGENDSGKSSTLDLLELFLSGGSPVEQQFRLCTDGSTVDEIDVILTFTLQDSDSEASQYSIDNHLIVRKIYKRTGGNTEQLYWGEKPIDDRLSIDFASLNAAQQKSLIQEFDSSVELASISNETKRIEWFAGYTRQAEKTRDWMPAPSQLFRLLPRFERYKAMDYHDPESIVSRTLKQVYERTIFEVEEREGITSRHLIEPLQQVERNAASSIKNEVAQLQKYIHKYNPEVRQVSYNPLFDFSTSFRQGEFLLDRGYGLHALSRIGDGTKRRMFMAVTDWDREVMVEQAKSGKRMQGIIRGYDEPDTNLHYYAQRLMYYSIYDIVYAEKSSVQAILCTHSLTMIDRAPAQTVRLLSLDEDGCTKFRQLETDDDPEIENFLKNLALELGITNSVMFYERCFVLIEGDTEEAALPILYRRLFGRSLIEDCIRLINVQRNSAIHEFLKLLGKNHKDIIIVLTDTDSKDCRDANLTPNSLKRSGFDEQFIQERLLFIGQKEFEDAFPNKAIARALQSKWARIDQADWTHDEIEALRQQGGKFSEKLQKLVWQNTEGCEPSWSKPIFGRVLAETCSEDEIPKILIDLLKLARHIAGINQ